MAYAFSPSGVNAQTGASYTFVDADILKLVTFSNGGAVGVTLPQAGAASSFLSGWVCYVENLGAGTVTITPTTSTIDGAATLTLTTNQGCIIFSDGTNYKSVRGIGSSATGTVTHTGNLTAEQVVVGNGTADLKILAGPADATKFLNGAATPAFAQVKDSDLSTSAITTNDVSITKHGFAPTAPNDATKFLDGTGAYSVPAGSGGASDLSSMKRQALFNAGGINGTRGLAAGNGVLGDLPQSFGTNANSYVAATSTHGEASDWNSGVTADRMGGLAGNGGAGMDFLRVGRNLQMMWNIYITRVTDVRLWIMLSDNGGGTAFTTFGATGNPAGNYMGFRFNTFDTSDTTFWAITKDGTTQTLTDTTISPSANQNYRLAMVSNDTVPNIKFYIDGVLRATHTTHLPASGSSMFMYCAVGWHSLTGVNLGFSNGVIQSDY